MARGRFAHIAMLQFTDEEGEHDVHGAVGHDGCDEVLAAIAAEPVHAGRLALQLGLVTGPERAEGGTAMQLNIGAKARASLKTTNHSKFPSIVVRPGAGPDAWS